MNDFINKIYSFIKTHLLLGIAFLLVGFYYIKEYDYDLGKNLYFSFLFVGIMVLLMNMYKDYNNKNTG
jgi:hypothetical protein